MKKDQSLNHIQFYPRARLLRRLWVLRSKRLNDPPFSPKYEPQDYPTPLSEVAPQNSVLDLGESKKISKSAKQECKYKRKIPALFFIIYIFSYNK